MRTILLAAGLLVGTILVPATPAVALPQPASCVAIAGSTSGTCIIAASAAGNADGGLSVAPNGRATGGFGNLACAAAQCVRSIAVGQSASANGFGVSTTGPAYGGDAACVLLGFPLGFRCVPGAGASLAGQAGCSANVCLAASVLGDAHCRGGQACVAASGAGRASCEQAAWCIALSPP